VNVAVATRMPVDELAVALAVHCKLAGEDSRAARSHLDVTPRSYFDEACVWADSNEKIIKLVRSDPQAIVAGGYSLNQARGWLSRLFGLGKSRSPTAPDDDELAQVAEELAQSRQRIDEDRARKLAALRELVDDSFDSAR